MRPEILKPTLLCLLILTFTIAACSDDSRRNSRNQADATPCTTTEECLDTFICQDEVCVPENPFHPDHDASSLEDTGTANPNTDTGSQTEPDSGFQPEPDPDGTLYPLNDASKFIQGTFERKDAAFDGILEQSAEEAASLSLQDHFLNDRILGTEWNCEMRMRRVHIHAPTDSPFLTTNDSLQGKPGSVHLVGKNDGLINSWRNLTSKSFSAEDTEIIFTPEDLAGIPTQVAIGIAFDQDENASANVAEIELFGYCTTPELPFTWSASEWSCNTACHVPGDNPGELSRYVSCKRGNGNSADNYVCEAQEPKPATTGGPCQLSCAYTLKFIGYRDFTYDNGSGWLHETSRRAGPLPYEVQRGKTPEEIQGKPCSLLTPADEPDRFFVGISCKNPDTDSEDRYCAFRCE